MARGRKDKVVGESLCKGKRCVVVGSGANAAHQLLIALDQLSESLQPDMDDVVFVGANGGGRIAHSIIHRCDVLCTTSHLFQQRLKSETATVAQLNGLDVRNIWVDVKAGQMDTSIADCVKWQNFQSVDVDYREKVVYGASKLHDQWISTGVWAVCLALYSGATSCHIAGIELATRSDQLHVEADTRVLSAMGYHVGIVGTGVR